MRLLLGIACIGILAFITMQSDLVRGQTETAESDSEATLQVRPGNPDTTTLTATAAYSVDLETKTPIVSHNAMAVLPIASITKLVSSAVWYQSVEDLPAVQVRSTDLYGMGRGGKFEIGDTYQASELVLPALLESANAASAMMQRVYPTSLLDAMAGLATDADATTAQFADAHGLSSGNQASAADVAKLYMHFQEQYPYLNDVTQLEKYIHANNGWFNNNPFYEDARYRGGKHGYTAAAGRTAVAAFQEPVAGSGPEREIIYVLLGSDDLAGDMERLRTQTRQQLQYQ